MCIPLVIYWIIMVWTYINYTTHIISAHSDQFSEKMIFHWYLHHRNNCIREKNISKLWCKTLGSDWSASEKKNIHSNLSVRFDEKDFFVSIIDDYNSRIDNKNELIETLQIKWYYQKRSILYCNIIKEHGKSFIEILTFNFLCVLNWRLKSNNTVNTP